MDLVESKKFYVDGLQGALGVAQVADSREYADELERYSQLITANPLPLEFYDDLVELMLAHSDNGSQARAWAHRVAVACCGKTHLYQDMGFQNRLSVSDIFHTHFPTLAQKNIGNAMRWKKFIYRQFCLTSGLPICPSASCSECPSRTECYAS